MKILYISPLNDTKAMNGGYSNIAYSFHRLFTELQSEGKIHVYTSISTSVNSGDVILHEQYDIGIVLTHPNSFNNTRFKNNILNLRKICNKFYINLFWETSRFPDNWDVLFQEDMFTGFISCSEFVKDLVSDKLKQFNSSKENHKVYPVMYTDDYSNAVIDIESKINENIFTVLYMGQYTKRKGMEDAVVAFTHALGNVADSQLILKYHRLSKLEFPEAEMIKRTVAMNCRDFKSHIYEITDNLNREQIIDLYKSSSLLLHTSRGEGFGLCITETGIVGLPLVYADNSSCSEVTGKNKQWSVPCTLDTAVGMSHYNYNSSSYYGIPKMSDTINAIQQAYMSWKTNKESYYRFVDKDFIFNKFSKDVVFEQIKKLK